MADILIVVEGPTEKSFVDIVLARHLEAVGVWAAATVVETSRERADIVYRGGAVSYSKVRRHVVRLLKQRQRQAAAFVSTMFDLYRWPGDAPGHNEPRRALDPIRRAEELEQAMCDDVDDERFIPFLQVHEFEALIFANLDCLLTAFPAAQDAVSLLRSEVRRFATPEHIDDREPPSKRLIQWIPEYRGRKVAEGPAIAKAVGLPTIRNQCMHFNGWISRLESLSNPRP